MAAAQAGKGSPTAQARAAAAHPVGGKARPRLHASRRPNPAARAQAATCRALAVAVAGLRAPSGARAPAKCSQPPPALDERAQPPPAPVAQPGAAQDLCSRTLAAVHALLESDATPPPLLAPLLRLLACCARCAPGALGPLWEDLLDLLLGWSLEPRLGDDDRWIPGG
jgi:hypothetical protein